VITLSARSVLLSCLLVALAVSMVSCGSSATDTGSEQASVDARRLVDDATLAGVDSGRLEARFELDNETRGEAVQWSVSTPFVGLGRAHGPELNARYEESGVYGGEIYKGNGRVLALADQTVLRVEGDTFGSRGPLFSGGDADCERVLESIQVSRLLRNISSRSAATKETTLVNAELDLSSFLGVLDDMLGSDACGHLLEQAGVPIERVEGLMAEVEDNFDKSEVTFTIGKDHALEGVGIGIWVRSPAPDAEEIDGRLEVVLSRFGEIKRVVSGTAARKLSANSDADAEQLAQLEAGAALLRSLLNSLGA
jgi:hypothetical protein